MMRLNKYIAQTGYCSRRQADELIASGKVRLNDELVTEMGLKVDETDPSLVVMVNGKELKVNRTMTYVAVHKPRGYTVTKDDPHAERTVMELLPQSLRHVNPIGRLDKDSEGLLLLTNDGEFTNQLTHPKFEKEKEYIVTTKKPLTSEQIDQLRSGVQLEEGSTGNVQVTKNPDGTVTIVLKQGWNRQIRRMVAKVGGRVKKLQRIRVGNYMLGNLPVGKWNIIQKNQVI